MTSVTSDIKDLLVEKIEELEFGRNLFIGNEPEAPVDTVVLFDQPGAGSQLLLTPVEDSRYEYSSLHIRIRNYKYTDAMQMAHRIISVLHNTGNKVINGTLYTLVESLDSPAILDYQNNNPRVIMSFAVQRNT